MVNFSDISSKISKGFGQAKQYAEEKMGTAPDHTQLPEHFRQLEQKCDSLKATYEQLMRIHKSLAHADDYSPPVGDQVKGVFGKLQEKLSTSKIDSDSPTGQSPSGHVTQFPSNYHAAGRIALNSSQSMDNELGNTLAWYGALMEELGEAKLVLAQRIQVKARRPLRNVLDVLFEQAAAARKQVFMARLTLDSLRRSLGETSSSEEVAKAQDDYNTALENAKTSMNAIIESPILSTALKEMIEVLKQYHRQCMTVLEGGY